MTNPLQVLVIDRSVDPDPFLTPAQRNALQWCDSSGNRSVFYWDPTGDGYGESGEDLPKAIFDIIKAGVKLMRPDALCERMEDPGLGIWIDSIDRPVAEAGGLPDGCIRDGRKAK